MNQLKFEKCYTLSLQVFNKLAVSITFSFTFASETESD